MGNLVQQAVEGAHAQIDELPYEKQQELVEKVLDAIDEAIWQYHIHSREGQAWAAELADKALAEHKAGNTVEFAELGE